MRAPERTSSRSYWPPHAQAAALAEEPSMVAQVAILRHVELFWDR